MNAENRGRLDRATRESRAAPLRARTLLSNVHRASCPLKPQIDWVTFTPDPS